MAEQDLIEMTRFLLTLVLTFLISLPAGADPQMHWS